MSDDIYIPPHKRIIDSSDETSPDGGGYNFVFYDKANVRGKKKKIIPPIGEAVSVNLSTDALVEINNESQEQKEPDVRNRDDESPALPERENPEIENKNTEVEAVSVNLSTDALEEIKERQSQGNQDTGNKNIEKTENENKPPENSGGHINITV